MIKYALILFLIFNYVYSYKILVYCPKLGSSHVALMGKISDVLVEAGHDVTMYLPEFINNDGNGTKLAKVIVRPRDFPVKTSFSNLQSNIWEAKEQDIFQAWKVASFIGNARSTICKHQLQDQAMMNHLRAEKFDIALGEYTCFYGLLEHIGIDKYITVFNTALLGGSMLGIPSTPSFVPNYVANEFPNSYLPRAKNLISTILSDMRLYGPFLSPIENVCKDLVRPDFDIKEQIGKSAFFLVNVDEFTDFPRPISHKIVYIGGMGQAKPKPLEPKYAEIMDSSRKGVFLVSFGSAAESYRMPQEMKKRFLEAFAQFPEVTFIWKYEKDEDNIAEGYPNVITGKWLPQNDLLAHPKILGLITHGGQNSISEAAFHGIPLICIPLFADQPRNGILVEYRKIGKQLDKRSILDGKLVETIKEILENPSYRKNAKHLSAMIRSKPMKPEERLVKYVEFAAEFGNDNNLDMYGREMNSFQYYCLDIILPLLLIVTLIFYGFYVFIRNLIAKIVKRIVGYRKIKDE